MLFDNSSLFARLRVFFLQRFFHALSHVGGRYFTALCYYSCHLRQLYIHIERILLSLLLHYCWLLFRFRHNVQSPLQCCAMLTTLRHFRHYFDATRRFATYAATPAVTLLRH